MKVLFYLHSIIAVWCDIDKGGSHVQNKELVHQLDIRSLDNVLLCLPAESLRYLYHSILFIVFMPVDCRISLYIGCLFST